MPRKTAIRRRDISKLPHKSQITETLKAAYLAAKIGEERLPRAVERTDYGAEYVPKKTDGDVIVLTGEPRAAIISALVAAAKYFPGKRAIAVAPEFPIEKADEYFTTAVRAFVIEVQGGACGGLYACGGTVTSGAAATRFTYRTEAEAKTGWEEIDRICKDESQANFHAEAERVNETVTVRYEFFDFADCERMTVRIAQTLKGNESVETLYAYDAPYQDEYMLSLAKAQPTTDKPKFARLNYYPLIAGRTITTKFVLGADEDFSPLTELIHSILTEERP